MAPVDGSEKTGSHRPTRAGSSCNNATSGYHRQARVENAFFRYKSIIGDAVRARSPGGQAAEALLACNILNRMTALGRPASYGIGR